jgi:DNA-binding NarL/FixJ family response regulator
MSMIKVAIISKHINKAFFESTNDISVFFPQSIDEALDSTTEILIIDDIGIPDNISKHIKVLVVGDATKEKVLQYLNCPNFYGFLKHDISPRLMTKAIRMVEKGEIWVNRRIISTVLEEFSKHIRKTRYNNDLLKNLSAREKEILNLISRGYSNKDVAKVLFISEKTVKTHLKNIFRKLGVNKRTEAISLLFQ